MKRSLSSLLLVILALAAPIASIPSHPADSSHTTKRSRRRHLQASANIASELATELHSGISHPRFTLTAQYANATTSNNLIDSSFQVNVVLTSSSVTETTSFSAHGGERTLVPKSSVRYFIIDPDSNENDATNSGQQQSQFAILAVHLQKQSVYGFLTQPNGRIVSFVQNVNEVAMVYEVPNGEKQDWSCFAEEVVDAGLNHRHAHHHAHVDNHHAHSHHHEQHDDNHEHKFSNLESLASNLGLPIHLQNRRRTTYQTDNYPSLYSYQVDLYIEVDTAMIEARDAETYSGGNIENTIEYVGAIVTAVSAIYEKEIDTHCK